MKPLYTLIELNSAKQQDLLSCECYYCKDAFNLTKQKIIQILNPNSKNKGQFCSPQCRTNSRKLRLIIKCCNCGLETEKPILQNKKYPNSFCSKSCATSYQNKNKNYGTRRSKLESWIEEQLAQLYPELHIDFNQKSAIGSELDIYIPSLNIAFELNGIFHYEPIYGTNKLNQIQSNDKSKSLACHKAKIDLCIIDTSQQKYVKPSTSKIYLDIIINIINERLIF